MNSSVKRVAVVATGVIGASWAAYFLARGLDVDVQALLLPGGAVGGVVIVEPRLADADEPRMRGERGEIFESQ